MTTAVTAVESAFASIVGASRVVSDPAACAAFRVDGKSPRWVVYAASAEQVAAVLRTAAEHDLGVIPCRNLTKVGRGNPPRRYDVALSLKEMNRVWHYEPADLTITAEPGMKFGDFQHFVGRDGLWLPLDPPGGARASLGGILATNASGPLRLRFGAPRDMLLGMKIATPEGKLVKTGGRVVKNVTGYDVAKLLIGSYGTLGVIVEASFKLSPVPTECATFVLRTGTLGIARDLRRRILSSPFAPLRLVLLDAAAATLECQGTPLAREAKEPEIWVEAGGSKAVADRIARELEAVGKAAGAPLERQDAETARAGWDRIANFGNWLRETDPALVVLKATLPDSASEEFLSRAQQEAENEKVRLASLVQMGVGVVLLALWEEKPAPECALLLARLRTAAETLGGALVIEHCPADLKAEMEAWGKPGDDFDLMKKVKAAWDPKGILSPGRFVGGL